MQHSDTINWNDVWKTQMQRHLELTCCTCDKMWDSIQGASQYLSQAQTCQWDVGLLDRHPVFTHLPPKSRILDIGAGPGTHSIPLALRGHQITAVEPAFGMVTTLQQRQTHHQLTTIDIIQKRWEDIDIHHDLPHHYDIALASFSLGMIDIQQAIQNMQECAHTVVLLWHVGVPTWEELYLQIWEKLHGYPYYPLPKSECLLNIIQSMNIHPQVTLDKFSCFYRFETMQHACKYFESELNIITRQQKHLLHSLLDDILLWKNDEFRLEGTTHYAIFSWETAANST